MGLVLHLPTGRKKNQKEIHIYIYTRTPGNREKRARMK